MAVEDVVARATGAFVLSSVADQLRIRELADDLIATATPDELAVLGADAGRPLDLRITTKLAQSKAAMARSRGQLRLAIVFAMWGEQRRLQPRTADNPTGEDALHLKLDQLDWLLAGTGVDWRVYAVDDGDPDDSAAVAEERAGAHEHGGRVRVLRLADAIPATTGALVGLRHVDDSRKGGAIVHGAEVAVSDGCDAVVMTDATTTPGPRSSSESSKGYRPSSTASPTPTWGTPP